MDGRAQVRHRISYILLLKEADDDVVCTHWLPHSLAAPRLVHVLRRGTAKLAKNV